MTIRDTVDLSGIWRFSPDPHDDGEDLGFWQPDYDAQRWREGPVPSVFEAGCPDLDFYEGVCWYRCAFCLPPAWQGRRVVLRFEAVNYRARVWLNGHFLGEHRDGFLPFEYEIHDSVRWNADDILVVSADNAHHAGDVPGMHVGWRGYGGILREVRVEATDPLHIESVRATATPDAPGGALTLVARLRNGRDRPAGGAVGATVYDTTGAAVLHLEPQQIQLATGASDQVILAGTLVEAHPWSPAAPILYRADVYIVADGDCIDAQSVRFGFRRIEATPQGLLLNGQPVFLTGFNRHEDSPHTAMAADLATARRDLEWMKEAGANFVRLCHYPHHPAELDLCDELGLLAFEEIPLYFWNDRREGQQTQAQRAESAARQLEGLICRDYNHPSLIFWSVSNETSDNVAEVAEGNRALIRRAKELDPTRLCVHVSNHWVDVPNFEEDDVVCVNGYPSIDWERRGHAPGRDLGPAAEWWRSHLAALHDRYPSRPILVTEFGYCSFAGTYGQSFGEDEHARVIEAEFAGFQAPYVCGAAIWCWADHPWPAGRFYGGLSISPFGVVGRNRRRLEPYWTARRVFRARQGMELPPAAPWPSGTGVVMLRPHMAGIPVVPFPEGYGIRPMSVADIGLWTDIQRDAEPFIRIGDNTFMDSFGDDLAALSWRCFIITDPKGRGVGTISAWYHRNFRGLDYGRIHWVAVRPTYQGRGLAKAGLSYAMQRLAQWHERAFLDTSTERKVAIRLYLDFGFEPDLTPPGARKVWTRFAATVQHPALERALAG